MQYFQYIFLSVHLVIDINLLLILIVFKDENKPSWWPTVTKLLFVIAGEAFLFVCLFFVCWLLLFVIEGNVFLLRIFLIFKIKWMKSCLVKFFKVSSDPQWSVYWWWFTRAGSSLLVIAGL